MSTVEDTYCNLATENDEGNKEKFEIMERRDGGC